MKIIEIGFSRNKHNLIGSNLIMKYLGADYSHCYIKKTIFMDYNVVYHSTFKSGVNFLSQRNFEKDNIEVKTYRLLISDQDYERVMKGIINSCGKQYGFMQNVGIVIVDVFRKVFKVNINNPFTKHYNCSELIYKLIITKLYPQISKRYNPNTVTPLDIDNILAEVTKV